MGLTTQRAKSVVADVTKKDDSIKRQMVSSRTVSSINPNQDMIHNPREGVHLSCGLPPYELTSQNTSQVELCLLVGSGSLILSLTFQFPCGVQTCTNILGPLEGIGVIFMLGWLEYHLDISLFFHSNRICGPLDYCLGQLWSEGRVWVAFCWYSRLGVFQICSVSSVLSYFVSVCSELFVRRMTQR